MCCRGPGDWWNLRCGGGSGELVSKAIAEVVLVLVVGELVHVDLSPEITHTRTNYCGRNECRGRGRGLSLSQLIVLGALYLSQNANELEQKNLFERAPRPAFLFAVYLALKQIRY